MGAGRGFRQHIKNNSTSRGSPPLPPSDHPTSLKPTSRSTKPWGGSVRVYTEEVMEIFFFKTKSPTQRGWVNCIISHLPLRTWEEERSRGEKIVRRNFGVHQSCMLFVKGAQQVLKWQIASCTTWINIDYGHL